MSHRSRRRTALVPLLATLATCAFPTDDSDQVAVLIQSQSGVVIRGQQVPLVARAIRVTGGDTIDVPNVTFQWTSGNAGLATVEDDGGGNAHVTGVNSGTVQIMARAVAYEQAELGSLQLRVSNPLEVDSVRPSTVRFGDTVTIFGVGVDEIAIAFLGATNAPLYDYPIPFLPTLAERSRDAQGFSRAKFWVPPPAHSARVSYIGPGVFGEAPDSTYVLPFDVFEPNEVAAWVVDLDALPFPLLPFLLFFNPGLAFEPAKRDELGIDWYRFTQTSTRDLTLVLNGIGVGGTFATFLTDELTYDGSAPPTQIDQRYRIGPQSWTIGPESYFCGGTPFEPVQQLPESTIVALAGMGPGSIHSLSIYALAGPYALRVTDGYAITNAAFPKDDHEEDDFCNAADARGLAVTVNSAGDAWRDTLTIDNPHEVDWIRFRVEGAMGRAVTLRVASMIAAAADSSDIDLYLLRLPGSGPLEVAQHIGARSRHTVTQLLPEGEYYAVVVDYTGRPTRYVVCIEDGLLGCADIPTAPAAAAPTRAAPRAATALPRLRALSPPRP